MAGYEPYARLLTDLLEQARDKGVRRKVISTEADISLAWLSQLANAKGGASPAATDRLVKYFASIGIRADGLFDRLSEARTPTDSRDEFRLIQTNEDLRAEMLGVADGAHEFLSCTGSRSRERQYLDSIIAKLRAEPDLVHHRALYGPPFHPRLKDHLFELIDLRNESIHNRKRITISIVSDNRLVSEQFVTANESRALVILPSFSEVGNFDTAMLFTDPEHVACLVRYGQDLTNCGVFLESEADIRKLRIQSALTDGRISEARK